jgi:Flp pilus assembly protein CpaB
MRRWWVLVIVIALFACTKTVYVPVEKKTEVVIEKRDTVVHTKIEKEVVEVVTADTVAVAQTRYAEARAEVSRGRLTLGLRNKDDSIKVATRVIYKTVRDSIPYTIEIVKEKKVRYVSWFDRMIRWVGGISFLIIVLAVAYKIFKWRIGLR